MAINSKCIANPKNAYIKMTQEGESPDYISLKTIKEADTTTVEGLRIRNQAIVELRDRYAAAIEGSKRKLIEMCKGHPTVLADDIIENYSYDCYEHFMMAVNGMDLKRIQHMKGSYSFYIQLVRYLAAYNRKVINKYAGGQLKAKPLSIYRPATNTDDKSKVKRVVVDGKALSMIKLKSDAEVSNGYVVSCGNKRSIRYNPSLTFIRDTKGRLMKVVDTDDEIVLQDDNIKHSRFNAYNVRSEWMSGADGNEISVFNTDHVGTTSIEEQMERAEESKVLQEAISKAFNRFTDVQKSIWENRMSQSAEQYEKKIENGKSAEDINAPSRPKYEELGKMSNISANDVKQNMKAMRAIISLEIDAANRKYHTSVRF